MWFVFAMLSAVFAALTSIPAKAEHNQPFSIYIFTPAGHFCFINKGD